MPISGTAQSHRAEFAQNLMGVPAAIAEYVTVVGQIPLPLERTTWVIVGSIVAALVLATIVIRGWQQLPPAARVGTVLVAVWGLLLVGWYGLFFGAGHFLSRYLFPLSPFFALCLIATLWRVTAGLSSPNPRFLRTTALAGFVLVVFGLNARLYVKGTDHLHFQIVEWVDENVPSDTWVGAVQTGTLGYFHDRTINLDGKVNPYALEAKLRDALPQYILDTPIVYLVDWVGIATWHDRLPAIRESFDVVVRDPGMNLAVLRRVNGE